MDSNRSFFQPTVIINGMAITVDLAATNDEIKKGLSGRASLDEGHGMLFLFSKPAVYRFWMLNMRFPIDIIWIHRGEVVSICPSVQPTFDAIVPFRSSFIGWLFRQRRPIFYSPDKPAQYVLEVNAGFSAEHNIVPGSRAVFHNIPTSL
jgi:uncharacterized membrane protein (UPF0127 family)